MQAELQGIPESESVTVAAEAVLADPLHWFGVRHHSPQAARFVLEAIRQRRPKVIFLEMPADAQPMFEHLVDKRTKPPVAVYSSFRDDDNVLGGAGIDSPAADVPAKYDAWFPLLSYSPEYIVLTTAKELGIEVVFFDLPFSAQLEAHDAPPTATTGETAESADSQESQGTQRTPPRWDDLAVTSRFYAQLAASGGYRSWDECWDSLFEIGLRHADVESFRRDMTYFCSALRATTAPERMESDGTLIREAHMWRTITDTLAKRKVPPSDAMVVCGGFHVFLSRQHTEHPPVPRGTHFLTVAPFSYGRTSSRDGYGAGNRAPLYYERLFDGRHHGDGAVIAAMVDHVVAVLHRGRKAGEALSAADAIAITQHARMLASLRGRKMPALDDVRDAIITCCCKGSPTETSRGLLTAMAEIEVGTAIGRVTPELGKLPLVYDFYRLVDELDLGEVMQKDKRKKLSLDLREPLDERRSVFFHRMNQIDVPFAKQQEGGSGQMLFREAWTVEWSPKVDAALIEKNLYGDTLEAAALATLDEEVAKLAATGMSAETVAECLVRAVLLDLPGIFLRLETVAAVTIDGDTSVASLGRALTHLVVLQRQAQRKDLRADLIGDLIERCYARGCFALPYAANVPPEEQAAVIAGMKSIAEVVLTQHRSDEVKRIDPELFVTNAETAYRDSTSQYLRGAFAGILTEMRARTPEDLAALVAGFAGSRGEVLAGCGDFLAGLVATSKTAILLGAEPLVKAIDQLLRAASWDDFMILIPRARVAFEDMHDRTRVALADRVAEIYGLGEASSAALVTLPASAGAAERLVRLDSTAEAIMKEWEFA